MKRFSLLIMVLALALLVAPQASADLYTLTSDNSTLAINGGNEAGVYGWTVDGFNILFQQWFWYRIGSSGPEQSIDTLGLESAVQGSAHQLTLTYGSTTGLEIAVDYTLTGGTPNSHTADVGEIITIHNHGAGPLDMHFFQYSDFDLNRLNLSDQVKIDPSLLFVDQRPVGAGALGPMLSETVLTPRPTHAEANFYANTLGKLDDGLPTTLNDVLSAGPGDVTWAFQWDKSISSGGAYIISKDKNLAPVPEPAPLALLGGILVVLARKFRTYLV